MLRRLVWGRVGGPRRRVADVALQGVGRGVWGRKKEKEGRRKRRKKKERNY